MIHYIFGASMETVTLLLFAAVFAAVAASIYICAPRGES